MVFLLDKMRIARANLKKWLHISAYNGTYKKSNGVAYPKICAFKSLYISFKYQVKKKPLKRGFNKARLIKRLILRYFQSNYIPPLIYPELVRY